jgi:hypothetical protein
MIKVRTRSTIVLGLSARNIERLRAGDPIKFPWAALGIEGAGDVFIVYGETESSICNALGIDHVTGALTEPWPADESVPARKPGQDDA